MVRGQRSHAADRSNVAQWHFSRVWTLLISPRPPGENPLSGSCFCSVTCLPYLGRKNSQQPPLSVSPTNPPSLSLTWRACPPRSPSFLLCGFFLSSLVLLSDGNAFQPVHSCRHRVTLSLPVTPQSLPKLSQKEKLPPWNDWRLFSCSDLTPGPLWRASRGQCSTIGGLAVLKAKPANWRCRRLFLSVEV